MPNAPETSPDTTRAAIPEAAEKAPNAPGRGALAAATAREVDGPQGPEPTRYGDWERRGRCIDF